MSKAFLLLGRAGDIISGALPTLYQEFLKTKAPQTLVVSKEFAPILEGASYVKPEVFNGGFQELEKAYREARAKFDEVTILGTFGEKVPIQPKTPSFQLDQCLRGGNLDGFGSMPLVFDQRNLERENKLLKGLPKNKPFILIADAGKSAPFGEVEALIRSVSESFPACKVIKLSEIKAEKPFDFLGLYDKAKALVSIDTMHLHLSAASKVPVLAWCRDTPSRWHGSCWQPRYHFHAYYSEWEAQKDTFLKALKNAVEGGSPIANGHSMLKVWERESLVPPLSIQADTTSLNLPRNAYNPSVARFNGKIYTSYRYHPKRGPKTVLAMFDGVGHKPIRGADEASFSYEDARLFVFQGELWISYVISTIPAVPPNCIVAYGKLVEKAGHWEVVQEFRPMFPENDFTSLSKNWAFFECNSKLYAIQSGTPSHTVIELEGDRVMNLHRSDMATWEWGAVRGGAVLPHGKNFIRFFHSRLDEPKMSYYVGAMLMEGIPPFKILKTTSQPILYGSDWETSQAFHHKKNVVFPAGIIKSGEHYEVSVGVNDSFSVLCRFKEEDLKL